MKPARRGAIVVATPAADGWNAAEPTWPAITSAAIRRYEPDTHGTNVTDAAAATPRTSSRLRPPRSAKPPNASCSPLPDMLPTVAISPARAMSSPATVLNTGQMPAQQSIAMWPIASASRLACRLPADRRALRGGDGRRRRRSAGGATGTAGGGSTATFTRGVYRPA